MELTRNQLQSSEASCAADDDDDDDDDEEQECRKEIEDKLANLQGFVEGLKF